MVVDASIMPLMPSAPTNLTTMMIAEHVARGAFAPAILTQQYTIRGR